MYHLGHYENGLRSLHGHDNKSKIVVIKGTIDATFTKSKFSEYITFISYYISNSLILPLTRRCIVMTVNLLKKQKCMIII